MILENDTVNYPLETVKAMMQTQYQLTATQVATFCADLCDSNRGNLSVGDMIRIQFNILPIIEREEPTPKTKLVRVK
jgi:hypothetical protein